MSAIVTARDDSALAGAVPDEILSDFGAGGGNRTPDLARMNDPISSATPRIARTCTLEGGAIADGDPSCFPLRRVDSSRNVTAVCDVERTASSPPAWDDVESSLARAIGHAAAAGRFDVVAQLVRELEARRSRR
jgi:hypothetical protein